MSEEKKLVTTSPAAAVLSALAECLTDIVLIRADESSLKRTTVKLPSVVYDQLVRDLKNQNTFDVLDGFGFEQSVDSDNFTFCNITYKRRS